jgi:CHAT domain-containing protein
LETTQASKEAVLMGLKTSTIHHFATHAYVSQRLTEPLDEPEGDEPSIALSGADTLRASEIGSRGRWLRADLTVLSACNTAIGKYQIGEGLLGLGRAFLIAGSRQVVVSLWSVSDGATAELMKEFYQRYLPGKTDLTAALHAAKLAVRQKDFSRGPVRTISGTRLPQYPQSHGHPYYWAGFVPISID